MNKKNLIVILLINFVIIAGTIYLIRSRYNDYIHTRKPILQSSAALPGSDAEKVVLPSAKQNTSPILKPKEETPGKPEEAKLRNIQFRFMSSKANIVSIIGDFNDWSPQPLKKIKNNAWEISLKVKPGNYKYNYIVDGKVILDPYNKKTPIKTSRGFESSILEVKPLAATRK